MLAQPASAAPSSSGSARPARSLKALEENEALAAALSALETERSLPSAPPTSGYAFERAWRDVRDRPDLARRLLTEVMTPEATQACFAKSLEPEIFAQILQTLDGAGASDGGAAAESRKRILATLAGLPSFALTKCFLAGDLLALATRVYAQNGLPPP